MNEIEQRVRCVRCGRRLFISDSQGGELLCSTCGLVLKDRIERVGSGWRHDNSMLDGGGTGIGPPTSITIHDMGLATRIASSNTDASDRPIPGPMRALVSRLRRWDSRSQVHESVDRNLRTAFDELDKFASRISVSEAVPERATYIYRKVLRRNMIR